MKKRAIRIMLVCGVLVASLTAVSSAWAAKTVCRRAAHTRASSRR